MNTRFFAPLCATGLMLAAVDTLAESANDPLPELKTSVKTVAAFKNGLAFVGRSGDTRLRDGWAQMDPLPPATLGSLWVGTANPSSPVTEIIAYKEKVAEEINAANLDELLTASVGHSVALTYATGNTTTTVQDLQM